MFITCPICLIFPDIKSMTDKFDRCACGRMRLFYNIEFVKDDKGHIINRIMHPSSAEFASDPSMHESIPSALSPEFAEIIMVDFRDSQFFNVPYDESNQSMEKVEEVVRLAHIHAVMNQ